MPGGKAEVRMRLSAPLLVAPLIVACVTPPAVEVPVPPAPQLDKAHYFPQSLETALDLLFVIDNSESMGQEQANLARNFPLLIEALRMSKLGGRIPDVHIGVISSDLGAGTYSVPSCNLGGDYGRLQNRPRQPGCIAPKDAWITYNEGTTNLPGASGDPIEQVKEAFGCIAEIGVGGCGFEHQLEAAKRALVGCGPPSYNCTTNPGFLRRNAYLAIVLITDEDDCSAARPELFDPSQKGLNDPLGPLTSFRCTEFGIKCDERGRAPGPRANCQPGGEWLQKVENYANFFWDLKPGRVMMFAIAGPTDRFVVGLDGDANPMLEPTCQSQEGTAVPALRIKAVIDAFGKDGHFNPRGVNICSRELGPALTAAGDKVVAKFASCLSAPPLTTTGRVACTAGEKLGPDTFCERTCLDQAHCVVEETTAMGSASQATTVIPKCPADHFAAGDCGDHCPCWRLVRAADCEPVGQGTPYRFEILRAGHAEAPPDAVASVRCAAAPAAWGSPELAALPQCL